ncbi:MAG: YebC/PmpR family DNA-binding transcriptional regulator, partial [Candidatus Marinimicrobia bacterium]|nr:YebC/PmpR family DNA-binding transcriptional regulator [Candidatus Neomarinimicrobiota bacterium]
DINVEEDFYEISTEPSLFEDVKKALEENHLPIHRLSISMIPKNIVKVDEGIAPKILKIMDALEEHEDIQNVYANFDIDDDILSRIQESG